MASAFRNIFHFEDEEEDWKATLDQFPNRVPRFNTKQQATEFVKKHCQRGSNPDFKALQHSVTTLIDWSQIENYLIPKIEEYNGKWESASMTSADIQGDNRFLSSSGSSGTEDVPVHIVSDYLQSRLNLSIHKELTHVSTMNTLRYMFFHMKCGIFVMIRNNEVVVFCPFVNKDYRNSWGDALKFKSADGTVETYYDEKALYYRREEYLPDVSQWWANGNIICNEYKSDTTASGESANQYWGDHFLLQLKDMFAEACSQRRMPDCDFFVNKRDYPHLKFNPHIAGGVPVEPYGFIFDEDDKDPSQDRPLPAEYHFASYAPIMSFYSSERFADIPIPPTEDWEAATGEVFPASFVHSVTPTGDLEVQPPRDLFTAANLQKFDCEWSKKVNTAFFRGTATGGGVNTQTNQRLHLAQLSYEWSLNAKYNGSAKGSAPFLDAKITGWNLRDKKIASAKMTHLRPSDFPFEGSRVKNFVEIYKQSTYKYLLYAEGHCAACRYGFMMQLGSVILKVDSLCVADQMWYFPLLKPFVDHVPVKADLSDLMEKLEWCHRNDDKCREIAENAKELYRKFVSREGILDYLQYICTEISSRRTAAPAWLEADSVAEQVPAPVLPARMLDHDRYCHFERDNNGLCNYCAGMKAQDEANAAAAQKAVSSENVAAQRAERKRHMQERKQRMYEKNEQAKKARLDDAN